MDIPYKIEIEPYELVYQIGANKAMKLVMEIEDCINNARWTQKLILEIIEHMSYNCDTEEMAEFINRIKKKARIK